MSLWGRNDQAVTANSTTTRESSNGAPISTYALVRQGGGANAAYGNTTNGLSHANVDVAMFGNTTIGAFVPGQAVGVFGVDTTEMAVNSSGLAVGRVTFGGTGYSANATVTITATNGGTSGVANAFANTTAGVGGKITDILVSTAGSGYITNPSIVISAPTGLSITANTTGVSNTADVLLLTTANSRFQAGDRLQYRVTTGNTAIPNLTGNAFYYVSFANTTALALSTTIGGANIDIAETRVAASETGHSLIGDTATGVIIVGGAKNKGVAHAGWVVRTEGSGGRAGRVTHETLVAMSSLGAQSAPYGTPALVADASDDTFLPDS